MKLSDLLRQPLVLLISFFLLLFAYSKFGPNLPFTVNLQSKGDPLTASGEGKVYVVPDEAKVTLSIDESGTSLKNTQTSVNNKSKQLIDALKSQGIKESEIKTTSYNVYPEYDYQSNPTRIVGYRVSTSYEVKILDFDKVNEVLSLATTKGANSVGGVSFDINEKTKKEKLSEARKLAVAEATQKAKSLAGAAGVTLGNILSISESENTGRPPIALLQKEAAGGEDVSQPDIQPGQTEVSVNINMSWEIR